MAETERLFSRLIGEENWKVDIRQLARIFLLRRTVYTRAAAQSALTSVVE